MITTKYGLFFLVPVMFATVCFGEPPTLDERVAALKTSVAESQAALKGYEWVETTVVSVKGEEKSRTMQRCYYGDDGAVQKTPIASETKGKAPRGIRGKIAEKKKEELTDYMKEAIDLVRQYVPPAPAQLQKCREAGNASIAATDPGVRVRLEFKNYRLPGDALRVTVKLADNTLSELSVSSYLGKDKDAVSLDVTFGKIKNEITYPASILLQAKEQNLTVSVTNSGYVRMQR